MSRYRLLKFLIPFFLGFYVFMIWLKPVIGVTHGEIFPFFGWTLFDYIPEWHVTENALIVHSIDGKPVSGTRYLIPNYSIRDWKALGSTVNDCRRLADCVQTLLPNVVAPETLITATVCVSSNCESPRKNFAWWVVTWKTLKNHRTAKIEGWALARGWALAQDNTVICFLKNCHHGNTIFISLCLVMKTEFKVDNF